MNNIVKNPVGIDKVIQRIQTYIYDKIDWKPIQAYGRVYKNSLNSGLVPQFYKGEGDYQKDVFIVDTDGNVGNIFFVVDDKHKQTDALNFQVEVKIVFMLDLMKIYKDKDQRQDSQAHKDAWNLVSKKNQISLKRLETGLETVLKGFDTTNVKNKDIEPLHIFALVGDLKYNINNC